MYVKTKVWGKKIQAMVDTGEDTVYKVEQRANEIRISYKKERGYVKGVNIKSLPIHGIARGNDIQIGPWRGKADITVVSLDDRKFNLGMDILGRAKAFIVPYACTLFIAADGQAPAIPMR